MSTRNYHNIVTFNQFKIPICQMKFKFKVRYINSLKRRFKWTVWDQKCFIFNSRFVNKTGNKLFVVCSLQACPSSAVKRKLPSNFVYSKDRESGNFCFVYFFVARPKDDRMSDFNVIFVKLVTFLSGFQREPSAFMENLAY